MDIIFEVSEIFFIRFTDWWFIRSASLAKTLANEILDENSEFSENVSYFLYLRNKILSFLFWSNQNQKHDLGQSKTLHNRSFLVETFSGIK